MLPTFVIGLREGLEAALIVSIIATFLRRNSASLRGMWLGVCAGLGLSIAVGVVLRVVEESLSQSKQEAMETVIGAIAVFFVTGMVVWMQHHARYLKRDLETAATAALKNGTTTALAVMAFLAVLREGFETSVFLLATITNAGSAPAAMWGAVLGIVVACGLGWGIYKGGVKLNLHRFFQITGAFLVLVAAGLTLMVFRTAHEAGWITVGQGRTVDLSWLAPNGSIRSALLSGVLGIPNDPRVIEVLAWACFLVPVALFVYWPQRWRPSGRGARTVRLGTAGALLGAGVLLVLLVPVPASASASVSATSYPSSLTLEQLLTYTGHRTPVGLNAGNAPGPYDATWQATSQPGTELLTLTGGGLTSPRALTVTDPAASAAPVATSWRVVRGDRLTLKYWLPVFLGLAALALLLPLLRARAGSTAPASEDEAQASAHDQKGQSHRVYASSEV